MSAHTFLDERFSSTQVSDVAFGAWFQSLLAASPFEAFFWECPPVNAQTFDRLRRAASRIPRFATPRPPRGTTIGLSGRRERRRPPRDARRPYEHRTVPNRWGFAPASAAAANVRFIKRRIAPPSPVKWKTREERKGGSTGLA